MSKRRNWSFGGASLALALAIAVAGAVSLVTAVSAHGGGDDGDEDEQHQGQPKGHDKNGNDNEDGDNDGEHDGDNGGEHDGGGDGNNGEGHTPVTLCHWRPAHGGSYIVITVDDDGADGNVNMKGHAGHEKDIIPAPASGCPNPTAEATNTPVVGGATETPAATMTAVRTKTAEATRSP